MTSLNKQDIISLLMKTTSKFYEVKEKISKQSVLQVFDSLYGREATHKTQTKIQSLKQEKNSGYLADAVYSSQDLAQKKETKKQPVLKGRMIKSERSDKILDLIQNNENTKNNNSQKILESQKSLGQVVWSLGMAQKAKIAEGISPHDMSCLLAKTADLKLYPITASKVIHNNTDLISLKSQEKKTKRYVLTPKGRQAFKKLFK